jgi:hypothetical protein
LYGVALPAEPERVAVSAQVAGDSKDLLFKWELAVDVAAKIDGRTLTIGFSRPFDADLAEIADLIAGYGRFVRLSADHKSLSINLVRDLRVAAERTPAGWTVHLTPSDAPLPSAQAAATEPALLPTTPAAPVEPDAAAAFAAGKKSEDAATPPAKPGAQGVPKTETDAGANAIAQPNTTPSIAEPQLTVSEGQDYTRLTFEWPTPVDYSAELVEGELTLRFKSGQEVRLSDLRVTPPKRVRGAVGAIENGEFTAHLKTEPGVSLRHAKEDHYIFIDLVGPPDESEPSSEGKAKANAPSGETGATAPPAVPILIAIAARPALATTHPPIATSGEAPPASQAPSEKPKPTGAPDTIKSVLDINDIDLSVLDQRLKGGHAEAEETPVAPETVATPDPEPLSVAVAPSSSFAMSVALESRTIKLGFPWGEPVPAAVVRRGDRLWIAFAREGEIDVSMVERVRAEGVLGAKSYPAKGATVIGLQLADHLLATVIPEPGGWTVALGDSILTPTPDIPLEKRLGDKPAEVAAQMPGELEKIVFRDPDVLDELVFVMAGAPARGFVSTRHFVDFELLAATQGLVVRPIADGVDVRLEADHAIITKKGGLHLAGTNLISAASANAVLDLRPSPAEMKFAEWRGPPKIAFTDAYRAAMTKVVVAEEAGRPEAEIDLAHLLLGYGLTEEALGVLKLGSDQSPQIASQPHFRILRGVANLLSGRPKLAKSDLDSQELPDDPNTALWVGLLAAAEQDFPRARSFLAKAEPAIIRLDNEWQAKARLRAAEAGLEINDFGWARSALDLMPTENLKRAEADEARLLRARLGEAMGDEQAAAIAYDALSRSPVEPIAVKAQLAAALLAARLGKISTNDAIDRLEALRFAWRGDAIEARTLLALGQLYAKVGDFRHALTTMRIAVRQFPGTPTERRVYQEMADLFERLFLDGKADQMPPVQALALYFDFKELTPIGPKGDVMIRRLSDRLVAMDLLDQAAELLKHQVDNRLSGVARSQVAARLALVQLMNHKPEEALLTVNNSRQARLPEDISAQRRLIEARALMDLKRYEHALDVISGDGGPTVDRLRADIHWHAEDWAKAGPALEAGLSQAFGAGSPLSEAERFDTMRAAISYALGNDRTGLARVKQEFSPKMSKTPDAHAFEVVTSGPGAGGVELYTLAERFAGIDTLADFLGQLKEKDVVPKIN